MQPTQPRTNGYATRPVVAPIAPLPAPTPDVLSTEYVSGGGWSWYSRLARGLPPTIDDITSDFGDDLYERMAIDPTIAKCLAVFKASVLEDGLDLNPAIKDEADPDYDLANRIHDEASAMLDELETSLDDVLWDLANCIAYGNVVAEQRFELKPGAVEKRELLQLIALKVKPRRTYAFVVDAYLNVIGLLGQRPGESNPYMGQVGLDPEHVPNILPREKFCIATFRPHNSDPRGTSLLRPAYDPWWRKRQLLPDYLKYLAQFAGPSIWGTTPEKAQALPSEDSLANPTFDTDGNLNPPFTPGADIPVTTDPYGNNPVPVGTFTLSPEQQLVRSLLEFRNGTAAAFPFGTQLHTIEMTGEGRAFLAAKADCDRDMIGAILTQTLATEEGEHQARAAAQVHQDVLDTLIRQAKRSIIRMVRRDILRPWVRYNWGEKALHLVPIPTLGETKTQDLAPLITALGAVGYAVDQSQMPDIDEMLNLPVRDMTDAIDDNAATGDLPSDGADQPEGSGTSTVPPSGQAQSGVAAATAAAPARAAVERVAVRSHNRNRPARRQAAMSSKRVDGAYSDADRRILVELFDDAFPEFSGLLDATVSDA